MRARRRRTRRKGRRRGRGRRRRRNGHTTHCHQRGERDRLYRVFKHQNRYLVYYIWYQKKNGFTATDYVPNI